MVEILLPKNSRVKKGKVWPAPGAGGKKPKRTKDFKIYYKKVPGDQPGTYSMDHTAATFVYDPQGKLRLYERYASGPEALASDVKQLLAA